MIEASCHCGAVTIRIDGELSDLTSCNCSICRRTAGLWTYHSPSKVHIEGATATYRWGDKTLDLHHCPVCGCITHWSPVDPALDRMGVNARLADPAVVATARVRRFDGADTWEFLD